MTDFQKVLWLWMVSQMGYFSHDGILKMVDDKKKGLKCNPSSIENLCEYYNLDKELIVDELDIFIDVYKATHLDIDISDVMSEKKKSERTSTANPEDSLSSDHDEDKEQEDVTVTDKFKKKKNVDDWVKRGFIRPYRCLLNLSGFDSSQDQSITNVDIECDRSETTQYSLVPYTSYSDVGYIVRYVEMVLHL
ncbi:hypothetical protein J6590_101836 [Homalodisca vitripennis]|nr:hypothetical protein J6590_101836 [Homalodisca vitripennis]